jgi:hypothetical protein
LPELVQPHRWQFAALSAGDLWEFVSTRPIPFQSIPSDRAPLALGIASTTWIPGVILEGGKQSRILAQWLEDQQPAALSPVAGEPHHGLILEAGLNDRWVMATFEDPDVIQGGKTFQNRLALTKGVHFLLVQPDDSGVTYTGFWLLQRDTDIWPTD